VKTYTATQLTHDQAKRAAQALMRASEAKDRRAQEQLDMRSSDKGAGWNAQRCETADHYRKEAFADRLLANELYASLRGTVATDEPCDCGSRLLLRYYPRLNRNLCDACAQDHA
jgi:hypothetical protein